MKIKIKWKFCLIYFSISEIIIKKWRGEIVFKESFMQCTEKILKDRNKIFVISINSVLFYIYVKKIYL